MSQCLTNHGNRLALGQSPRGERVSDIVKAKVNSSKTDRFHQRFMESPNEVALSDRATPRISKDELARTCREREDIKREVRPILSR